jgi:type II secretory pathway predicted ATPase ExeA
MSTQLEIFNWFNLGKPKVNDSLNILETKTYRVTKKALETLITDNKWRAFSGRIGSGKTVTIIGALREIHDTQKNFDVVEILSPDRKMVSANQILASFVSQMGKKYIGSSKMNRSSDARYAQVQRILMAAYDQNRKIVLVIDEAQELNPIVLNTIKRLRDTTFAKRSIHLPVILIGQPSLEVMISNNDEVKNRIRNSQFGYKKKEIVDITQHLGKGLLTREQCLEIVKLKTGEDEFRRVQLPTPLEIDDAIEIAMENAFNVESNTLDLIHFEFEDYRKKEPKKKPEKVDVSQTSTAATISKLEDKAAEAS